MSCGRLHLTQQSGPRADVTAEKQRWQRTPKTVLVQESTIGSPSSLVGLMDERLRERQPLQAGTGTRQLSCRHRTALHAGDLQDSASIPIPLSIITC